MVGTTKKVAIVGGGPSGKSAARELVKSGVAVTVFDREGASGGLMRYGYPSFRMPTAVSERDQANLAKSGVVFKSGQVLGESLFLDDLTRDFAAVLLAIGAPRPRRLGIPGEDLPRVYTALEFLRAARLDRPFPVGQRIVVIGGGDTAIDAATSALWLGADSAVIAYRGTEAGLKAQPHEVMSAKDKGVSFDFGGRPAAIVETADGLAVRLDKGSHPVTLVADAVIVAIGQDPDPEIFAEFGLAVHPDGTTDRPGVFVTGGALYGSNRLSNAILSGRRAAAQIIEFLGMGEAGGSVS